MSDDLPSPCGSALTGPVRPWEKCKEHGPAQPRVWACPACLVELRTENDRLRTVARLVLEATPEQMPLALDALRDVFEP